MRSDHEDKNGESPDRQYERSGVFYFWMKFMNKFNIDHNNLIILILFCITFLGADLSFYPSPVHAQTDKKVFTLDTMVVTADKPDSDYRTGDVDTDQTPAFFTVIHRDQFEGKMENLADLVEKEVGIQVRQSGGIGSFSSVSLRGSTSEQVLIYMDGILLNDASGGGVDLSNISLADVEAIEIYRGTSPGNFSKAGIGGVINIRTSRSKKKMETSVQAGYGSFNTRNLSAFINHKPGRWDYVISGDYIDSDNDFDIYNDNGTPLNPDDDRWEKRRNARLDQTDVLARFGYDFTDDTRLDFIHQWYNKDQGLPSWNNSRRTQTTFETTRMMTSLELRVDNISSYGLNAVTNINYLNRKEEYDDSEGHIGLGRQHTIDITDRYGAGFYIEYPSSINVASMRMDFQQEKYAPEDHLYYKSRSDSRRDTFSVGLQDSLLLLHDTLIITPAIRFSWINDKLLSAISPYGMNLDEQSVNRDHINGQIGVKYRPWQWITMKVNVGQYTREPSFFELFGDRGFFVGNIELADEKSLNIDAGIELESTNPVPGIGRVALSGTWFQSDVEDLISRVYNSRGIGKSENISESVIQGIELGLDIRWLKWFRFLANATIQDTENRSQVKAFEGKKLPGRFEKTFTARLETLFSGIKLYGEYQQQKDMFYDTANLLPAENKDEFNAGISVLWRSFLITLEGKNLGDDLYEDFNGYPLPGRSYRFSVKYSF